MASDVIENHVRRLPPPDPVLWSPRLVQAAELEHALLTGRVAGPATHPLDNVRGNGTSLVFQDTGFWVQGFHAGLTTTF